MNLDEGFKDRLFIKKFLMIALAAVVAIAFCLTLIAPLFMGKSGSYSVIDPDKALLENLTQELQKSRQSDVQMWEE